MDSDSLMLNKLIILYILDRVELPISNAELTRIILEKQYASFIEIVQALDDLVEDTYIEIIGQGNSHQYKITPEGAEVLSYFLKDISVPLRDEIDEFLLKEQHHLRDLAASTSAYSETGMNAGEYLVDLKVVERGSELVRINLLVYSEEEAETVCNRWREANTDVYEYLIQRLVMNKKNPEKED